MRSNKVKQLFSNLRCIKITRETDCWDPPTESLIYKAWGGAHNSIFIMFSVLLRHPRTMPWGTILCWWWGGRQERYLSPSRWKKRTVHGTFLVFFFLTPLTLPLPGGRVTNLRDKYGKVGSTGFFFLGLLAHRIWGIPVLLEELCPFWEYSSIDMAEWKS